MRPNRVGVVTKSGGQDLETSAVRLDGADIEVCVGDAKKQYVSHLVTKRVSCRSCR